MKTLLLSVLLGSFLLVGCAPNDSSSSKSQSSETSSSETSGSESGNENPGDLPWAS